MNTYIGIDPGKKGAMVVIDSCGCVRAFCFNSANAGISFLRMYVTTEPPNYDVCIEHVYSSPQMGVTSAFSFGENFGWWKGVLDGLDLRYRLIPPVVWQTKLGCRTGGDKRISLKKARQLFLGKDITLDTADAFLIAEYCRRTSKI